ncbi:hypothetical protein [Krasilnikovia sp. MM14-A1259]|uniref:hypothetical protein n=1 Tax=Krasilnikovia sp. MM14-A1259 TaxID=3373539 RepID=UPI00381C4210
MTDSTTAGALTKGALVLVSTDDGTSTFARKTQASNPATVTAEPIKAGRRLRIPTDLGEVHAAPTTRVLLASPEQAAKSTAPSAPVATVTVNVVGSLTTESRLRVGDREVTVPTRSRDGSAHASRRLTEALADLDYAAASPWRKLDAFRIAAAIRPK